MKLFVSDFKILHNECIKYVIVHDSYSPISQDGNFEVIIIYIFYRTYNVYIVCFKYCTPSIVRDVLNDKERMHILELVKIELTHGKYTVVTKTSKMCFLG